MSTNDHIEELYSNQAEINNRLDRLEQGFDSWTLIIRELEERIAKLEGGRLDE